LIAKPELPVKVIVSPITCVQVVLVPAPPEKSIAPVGKYTAPPRYCVAPR
jgi:hypothetical protein